MTCRCSCSLLSLDRYKRKPRDEGKEHGGFALLRFETPEEAIAAVSALNGSEIQGAVRISHISRTLASAACFSTRACWLIRIGWRAAAGPDKRHHHCRERAEP